MGKSEIQMEELEYGNKIVVTKGIFEGNRGIFFRNVTKEDCKEFVGLSFKRPQSNDCMIEVFFKTQAIKCPDNINNYFEDYLFNENIPKKTTSVIVIISRKDIIKMIVLKQKKTENNGKKN